MKTKRRTQILILSLFFILMLGSVTTREVTAKIDPGDGGGTTDGDNAIANAKFESGTASWTDSGGIGVVSYTTSPVYEGEKALSITGVVAIAGIAATSAYQVLLTDEPISDTTILSGAVYYDANTLWSVIMVGIHITPADYTLAYYYSDTFDFPDISGSEYRFDLGSSQDTWHKFSRSVQADIEAKGLDPAGQSIDIVVCHVRSTGIITNTCNGYFDDLYIGSTPPDVEIELPANNQWIRGTYTFEGNAVDNRNQGLVSVNYLRDPTSYRLYNPEDYWSTASGTTSWEVDIDTTSLTEGTHSFYVWATDVFGTTSSWDTIAFKVDNTDPTIGINSHSNNVYVKNTITISGESDDARSGISVVKYNIDSAGWQDTTGTDDWSFSWDTNSIANGEYVIAVRAYDLADNYESKSITLIVDNTNPTISSTSISPAYANSSTTVTVSGSFSDVGSYIASIGATIERPDGTTFDLNFESTNTGGWTGTFNLEVGDDQGVYVLKSITVQDAAGNTVTSTPSNKKTIFDTSDPTLSIDSPSYNALVSGATIAFDGSCYDSVSGLSTFSVSIDGQTAIQIASNVNGWNFDWDPSIFNDGYHVFEFYVKDAAGNSITVIWFVVLRNDDSLPIPFVPVVDQDNHYHGNARVTVGDSQLVLVFNTLDYPDGTAFRFLIASPYSDLWGFEDISYVAGPDTVSFYTDSGVIWNPSSDSLYFDYLLDNNIVLDHRSIFVSMLKTDLTWTLDSGTNLVLIQDQEYIVSFNLGDSEGSIPIGLPGVVGIYAIQNNEYYFITTSNVSSTGHLVFTFTLNADTLLCAGTFTFYIDFLDVTFSLYDTTTAISGFDGFVFYRQVNWIFDPSSTMIIHYTPVEYDQRNVLVKATLTDANGIASTMIGHAIEVRIVGSTLNETRTIYQTKHDDGIYALFSYNLTQADIYDVTFTYIPTGYYLAIDTHSISIQLEEKRPIFFEYQETGTIQVGSSIILETILSDAWAQNYPIYGAIVNFEYSVDGHTYSISSTTTNGYGVAKIIWMPTEQEWNLIAGKNITIQVSCEESTAYLAGAIEHEIIIGLVSTWIQTPLTMTSQLVAGDTLEIHIEIYDQFGAPVNGIVQVVVSGPNGFEEVFDLDLNLNSDIIIVLDRWGIYMIAAQFTETFFYSESNAQQEIRVLGQITTVDVQFSYDGSEAVALNAITVHFYINDLEGTPLNGEFLLVMITWQNITTNYNLEVGFNDTLTLVPEVSGEFEITCTFKGDWFFEPAKTSVLFQIHRRPVEMGVSVPSDSVYPYVSPSEVSYIISAEVNDDLNGLPMNNATVLFCYVTQNESIYLPYANETGYVNLTLVDEYLAWGLFHSIGTAFTNELGLASIEWFVDLTLGDKITIFALTLRNEIHETGLSAIVSLDYSKISTEIAASAEWTGEGKEVSIDINLFDEFGNPLYGEYLFLNITSLGTYEKELFTILTGFNNSFTWIALNFGAYQVDMFYNGSDYYYETGILSGVFVVSWRNVAVTINVLDVVYAGYEISLNAHVEDLNSTSSNVLLEPIVVYFAYFEDGVVHTIGQGITDSNSNAAMTWIEDLIPGNYYLFAYTKRQLMYDAGLSSFAEVRVIPIDTFLSVDVIRTNLSISNLEYSINVSLVDEFGNDMIGEIVTLYLTDNYTEFWTYFWGERKQNQGFTLACGNHGSVQVYVLTVIIGYNDSIIWLHPGKLVKRAAFALGGIVIADYSGSSTHLPTISTEKMARKLILTRINLDFNQDKLNTTAGLQLTLSVRVLDECNRTITLGFVNMTIIGHNGQEYNFQIDLSKTDSLVWIPPISGQYVIEAHFLGGIPPTHCYKNMRLQYYKSFAYNLRLTRSYNKTGILVVPQKASIIVNPILSNIFGEQTLVIRAIVIDTFGVLLTNHLVKFFYLDENGVLVFLGSNYTNSDGIVFLSWTPHVDPDIIGYASANLFTEVLSASVYSISRVECSPIKIWPELSITMDTESGAITAEAFMSNAETPDLTLVGFMLLMAIPAKLLNKRYPHLLKMLALAIVLFSMVTMCYCGLGIESHSHPFEADLISNLSTNPNGAVAPEQSNAIRGNESIVLATTNAFDYNAGITSSENTLNPMDGFAVSSPNATYVVLSLTKTLTVNFTAYGQYVVTVLDSSQKPVDVAAGIANGNTSVSFSIDYPKYIPGNVYTVNTFVTVQRAGIVYGDTGWIQMIVSKTATVLDLILEQESIKYSSSTQDVKIAAKLTQMHETTTVSDAVVDFYYRTSKDLTWYLIGSAVTRSDGIALLDWVTSLPKDTYVINATYAGDELSDKAMSVKLLEVEGASTILGPATGHITKYWTEYSHPFTIFTQLRSYTGNPLADRVIEFYLSRTGARHWIGSNTTDSNGIAELTYSPYLPEGTHNLLMLFEGDANYAPANNTYTDGLIITKQTCTFVSTPTSMSVVSGETVTLSARIENSFGMPIINQLTQFEIYDSTNTYWELIGTEITDVSGYVSVDYNADLASGKYVYRVTMLGDDSNSQVSIQGILVVAPESTNIFCNPVSVKYGQMTTIFAHLQDENNYPLSDQTLLFYILVGDVWIPIGDAQTSSTGWVKLDWQANLGESIYNLKVIYPGNIKKASYEWVGEAVTISKAESILTLAVPSKVQVTLPSYFNVTLVDTFGTPLIYREVNMEISAGTSGVVEDIILVTDESGMASYRYIAPYLGDYEISASFSGDSFYTGSIDSELLEAGKIELAISLIASQFNVHRGDMIIFSGYASYYDPDTDSMVPAEGNIFFDMELIDTNGYSLGNDWNIQTVPNGGDISGHWVIPRNIDYLLRIQAGDYTLVVRTGENAGYTGESEFSIRMIERTTLEIIPERNGNPTSEFYVDLSTDFRFTIYDEDEIAQPGISLDYSVGSILGSGLTGSGNAQPYIVYSNYIPENAGGLLVTASYLGSEYLDSAFIDLSTHIFQRNLIVSSSSLSLDYAHRSDIMEIDLELLDGLSLDTIIDTVELIVLVDGIENNRITEFSGTGSESFILPDTLQSGDHTITIMVSQSRVYNEAIQELLFVAYELSCLKLKYPDNPKTLDEYDLRLSLTDEDGTPLENRFVDLALEKPDGDMVIAFLETDHLGEAHYRWNPKMDGYFVLESRFDGEYLYEGTSDGDTSEIEIEVEDGSAVSESGPSPIWMLPIILLIAVDVALEIVSFGCLAYLNAEGRWGDAKVTIKRIAYPSIEIMWVTVNLPIVGSVQVPIPIPFIYTEFEFSMTSPTLDISVKHSYNDGFDAKFNGLSLFDVIQPLTEIMSDQESAESSMISTTSIEPTKNLFLTLDESETSSPMTTEIMSPGLGETMRDMTTILVQWKTYHPDSSVDTNTTIAIDGGDPEYVTPWKIQPSGDGAIHYYEKQLHTVTASSVLNSDALSNGAHKIKVATSDSDSTVTDTSHFYVVSRASFFLALSALALGILVAAIVENWATEFFVSHFAAMPWWAQGVLGGIVAGVIVAINFLLTSLFLDATIYFFGVSGLAVEIIPGVPLGYLFAALLFVLGLIFLVKGHSKAPAAGTGSVAKGPLYIKMMIIGGLATLAIPLLINFLTDLLFPDLPPLFDPIKEAISSFVTAMAYGAIISYLLSTEYKAKKGQKGRVSENMQWAILKGSIGIGIMLGAIPVIQRTSEEHSRVYY